MLLRFCAPRLAFVQSLLSKPHMALRMKKKRDPLGERQMKSERAYDFWEEAQIRPMKMGTRTRIRIHKVFPDHYHVVTSMS